MILEKYAIDFKENKKLLEIVLIIASSSCYHALELAALVICPINKNLHMKKTYNLSPGVKYRKVIYTLVPNKNLNIM